MVLVPGAVVERSSAHELIDPIVLLGKLALPLLAVPTRAVQSPGSCGQEHRWG